MACIDSLYDDQLYLVSDHQRVEEILATQAIETRDTLKEVIVDKNILHDIIIVKDDLATENIELTTTFKEDFHNRMKKLEDMLAAHCQAQQQSYTALHANITTFMGVKTKDFAKMRSQVTAMSDMLADKENGLSNLTSAYADQAQKQTTTMKDDTNKYHTG